jgi:hypothetical protein
MKLIRKFEKLVLALILGLIAPLIGLLGFWWGCLPFLAESLLPYAALAGALLGLLLEARFLRGWMLRAHRLDLRLWMAVHLFYSAVVFGFFMGLPAANALLAVPAGFVVGGRLAEENADPARVRTAARRTAWFTAVVLALVCAASAVAALASPSTPSDLRGMLGLDFEITQAMAVGLILACGAALLAFGWLLTAVTVRFSYTFLQRKE